MRSWPCTPLKGSIVTDRKLMIEKRQKEGERPGGSYLNPNGKDDERWIEWPIDWKKERRLKFTLLWGDLPVR